MCTLYSLVYKILIPITTLLPTFCKCEHPTVAKIRFSNSQQRQTASWTHAFIAQYWPRIWLELRPKFAIVLLVYNGQYEAGRFRVAGWTCLPLTFTSTARLSFWSAWTLLDLMGSHCGTNSTNMHPSAHQTSSHGLTSWRHCFACSFLDNSCVIPFHTLSFGFWMKIIKLAVVTSHNVVKKVVMFDSTSIQQLRGKFFSLKSALLRLRARNLHGKTLPLDLMSTISCITQDYSISAVISPTLVSILLEKHNIADRRWLCYRP